MAIDMRLITLFALTLLIGCADDDLVTPDGGTVSTSGSASGDAIVACSCPNGWIVRGDNCERPCAGPSDCPVDVCSLGTCANPDGYYVCQYFSAVYSMESPPGVGQCTVSVCDDYNDCTDDSMGDNGVCVNVVAPIGSRCQNNTGYCDLYGCCR